MTGIELKPCPFCGSEAVLYAVDIVERYWGVECKNCRCVTLRCGDGMVAIERWNTCTQPKPTAQVFGEWIYGERDVPHCSECGAEVKEISTFCPQCGAKMKAKEA